MEGGGVRRAVALTPHVENPSRSLFPDQNLWTVLKLHQVLPMRRPDYC
jgi:hypothetical protein